MGTGPIDIQDLTTLRSTNRVYESQRILCRSSHALYDRPNNSQPSLVGVAAWGKPAQRVSCLGDRSLGLHPETEKT
ncbi:hypothetical protein QUB68_12085 [Microcoleus sp. A006_D1]|uniref:hypothetical protein n=1 Tax=Microcoleus sp. A006_D1 TaxID=3055267 RepID=UPI002FD08132